MKRRQRNDGEREEEGEARARDVSTLARLRKFGFLKLLGLVLTLGIAMGILSVHLIPYTVRAGVPPPMADKLPYLGLFCGVLVGFAAAVSRVAMDALQIGLAIPLTLFALLGWLLSVVMSMMWSVALLEFALPAGAIIGALVLLVAGLCKLYAMFESRNDSARQHRNR